MLDDQRLGVLKELDGLSRRPVHDTNFLGLELEAALVLPLDHNLVFGQVLEEVGVLSRVLVLLGLLGDLDGS